MAKMDDEEERLREVALRNAQSILLARRRAEEALQQQSEWLRVTLASIAEGVISTDAGGRVTYMNPVAETLTGWPVAEALGHPLPDIFHIVHERTRQSARNPALDALRMGKPVALANHTVLVARDGSERPIDDSASPMRDESGATLGTVLIFRDVSERKRAEEARARLAAIVESSDDAIVSKTLDGVIRSWNTGAERIFGYTSQEAVGQPITMIIPSDRHDEERMILDRIRRGERVEHFETVRVGKDGRRIDISLTVSPVRDDTGRVVGASKIARDITEQVGAAARLAGALEREQQQGRLLREQDERKNEFLALLAHELRNPLAPLRNGLQVMRLAEGNAAAVYQARTMMERQLGHMVRLVDDLLDVSRISRNKIELRRSRILLADAVNSAVETVRPLIDAAGHTLRISIPSEPIFLDADLTRLAQVFGNLLTNSTKYTSHGGRITLTAMPDASQVVVSIRDNGIGIPADSLPTVFDMFSQVDRSIERSAGGLGIGLALVKGLVEMHGGSISAESAGEGLGSTFTVRLPLLEDSVMPQLQDPVQFGSAAAQSGRRILVVDDNRDSSASMAMMLKFQGDEVRTAHDGAEALQIAEDFRPHAIIMDMGMPRLNGYEATRRLRQQSWGRDILIIALTGWGQESDKARSHEAGCDVHLVKPVDLLELQQVLAECRVEK
jgi:PAS domain S-box-containing protein